MEAIQIDTAYLHMRFPERRSRHLGSQGAAAECERRVYDDAAAFFLLGAWVFSRKPFLKRRGRSFS
jgi:hypothetical protein